MDYATIIVTIIGSIIGGGTVGSIVTAYALRKKTTAEAESTLSTAILAYTNKLTSDNDKLRVDIEKMQDDAEKLQMNLRKAKEELDKAQLHAKELEGIVTALEARRVNDKVVIDKLLSAIKNADPNNPLIIELQALMDKQPAVVPPK